MNSYKDENVNAVQVPGLGREVGLEKGFVKRGVKNPFRASGML